MPPKAPVSLDDRIAALGGSAIAAGIVFMVCFAFYAVISKGSDTKLIQGRPVVWWVPGLYFLGACFGVCLADNERYYLSEVVGGMGGFGLLTGLAVGNLHGFLNLRKAQLVQREKKETEVESSPYSAADNDPNPYRPPKRA